MVAIGGLKKKEGSNSASSESGFVDKDDLGVRFMAAFGVVIAPSGSGNLRFEFAAESLARFNDRLAMLRR